MGGEADDDQGLHAAVPQLRLQVRVVEGVVEPLLHLDVAAARRERPDVILMDVALGAMDGWEATRLIKQSPETADIPVIALTAHALESDRAKSVAVGCVDFDTKPVDMRRLLQKMNACLDGRRLTEVATVVAELPERVTPADRANAAAVFSVILETLVERHEERVVVGGASNLTPADFTQGLHEVLEALEEQVVLMRLLGESGDQESLTVRIGSENEVEGLQSTSLVATGYGSGDLALAKLGVDLRSSPPKLRALLTRPREQRKKLQSRSARFRRPLATL